MGENSKGTFSLPGSIVSLQMIRKDLETLLAGLLQEQKFLDSKKGVKRGGNLRRKKKRLGIGGSTEER